jgi:PTS system D-glucosamine-specific IIC component
MKDKIFGVLQRVGRSFMLPIALLPVAGLLLGIGSSFTNQTMLEAYGLTGVIHPGTIPYTVLDIMNQCGSVVFNNLALLFAMGVAIGMAKKEKEVAALSGAIAYLVMNTAISAMIGAAGGVEAMAPNTTTSMLGITTLQMGVFGGIIVGLGVAALHNRFYKTQLPQVLSFFGGTRFVPIVSTAVYLLVGIAMFYVWPVVQTGISMLGNLVISSGYAGTFIYGLIERALIPFGLHHVFYMPFWQTAVGGSAIIDGVTVQGAQNIFFAELASKTVTEFSVDATRFMAGKFPLMIFGLPGAALAMYRTARPEKRKAVAGLLLSAALTSMITGITEPLEFTFLFVAPLMYAVHCVYAGLAYMLMHILNVCVGMTFSGGLIDLTLFGILQGNDKTHWIWVVVVGAVYFVVYYLTFSAMIVRMDLKTPGREADGEEAKLYTRSDFKEKTGIGPDGAASSGGDAVSAAILRGLGGKANSRREAFLGGFLGGVALMIASALMMAAMLCFPAEVAKLQVPNLFLAQQFAPALALIFSVILLLGIYSTAAPMFWVVINKLEQWMPNKTVKMAVTVILGVVAYFGAQIGFGKLIGFLYPLMGQVGVLMIIVVLVKVFILKDNKDPGLEREE